MSEQQFVVCRLGSENYGIPITQVKEIIRYEKTTKLPNTPSYLNGIINLRGKLVPIVDLSVKCGLAAAKAQDRRAVIVETAGQDIGILVDEVSEVLTLAADVIETIPAMAVGGDYVQSIGKHNDRLIILLTLDNLFTGSERTELATAAIAV